MARSMTPAGRVVSRPAQGKNSLPVPAAKASYATDVANLPGRPASFGSVSRPTPGPKAAYKAQPGPRRVRD